MSDNFYILSADGGGFRGLFSAHILEKMEQSWDMDWLDHFDMFAGTSTGAILMAGLTCQLSAKELKEFYVNHGPNIFQPRRRSRLNPLGAFASRYSSTTLQNLLEEVLGNIRLGDISKPLILPAIDIDNGCVHLFKSKYDEDFDRDPQVRVADAVLASCSAPTYFDPHTVNPYRLADGGLWANNPALVAAIDAHFRLQVPLEDIRVVSIGTGKSKAFYSTTDTPWAMRLFGHWLGWGFLTRWQGSKLFSLIHNLQADNAHNMLCMLLGERPASSEHVFRLTFDSEQPLPMDSTEHGDVWINKADQCYSHSAEQLREFLNL